MSKSSRGRRVVVLFGLLVAGALVTACGGGGQTNNEASATSAPDPNASELHVIDDTGRLAKKATPTKFTTVEESAEVVGGDVIETDDTGFAEVNYPDGSLTRIDVNTTFVVESAKKTETKARLSQGQIWNEVERATGSQSHFEVATPNAVAAVRGTAFSISCDAAKVCIFTVVEGTVAVTNASGVSVLVTAGQQVTVDAKGTIGKPEKAVIGQWIQQNQDQDSADGRVPPGGNANTKLSAESATPDGIATAIMMDRDERYPDADFIGAPYGIVECDGNGTLSSGDITHCVASGPADETVALRAVVLDDSGTFSVTRRQSMLDLRRFEAQLVRTVTADDGARLSSAECAGAQFVVVDLPSTFASCNFVDDRGRRGVSQALIDADGGTSITRTTLR